MVCRDIDPCERITDFNRNPSLVEVPFRFRFAVKISLGFCTYLFEIRFSGSLLVEMVSHVFDIVT